MEFIANHPVLVAALVKIAVLLFIVMTALAYLTWFERKVVARIQSRWGPYYVGAHGLLQPLADGIKFLFKEDVTPPAADLVVYLLAPFLALSLALTAIALIPFGPPNIVLPNGQLAFIVSNVNIGLLALFAITSIGVYGVALAGWSSNSKYALLGGLRSSAQMISYELALTLSVVGVLLIAGDFSLRNIVDQQAGSGRHGLLSWNIFPQVIGFVCFFIAAIAETNRVPFDLPEAESELVAGFHTEYASMKFAMFFIAEYTSMITVSCLATIMFFGGWLSPFPDSWTFTHYLPSVLMIPLGLWMIFDGFRYENLFGRLLLPAVGTAITLIGAGLVVFPVVNDAIQGVFWFLAKVFTFLFVYIWMRGTLPRFRYDQLMSFGWKFLLPVSIANVVLTSVVILWRMH